MLTGAGGLGSGTTHGSELDVEGSDAEFLGSDGNILKLKVLILESKKFGKRLNIPRNNYLRSQHSGVGRRFISISFDLHTAGNSDHGFFSGQIGDVDEGIVEGGVDVSHTEDELTFLDLGSKRDLDLLLGFLLSLTRSHVLF